MFLMVAFIEPGSYPPIGPRISRGDLLARAESYVPKTYCTLGACAIRGLSGKSGWIASGFPLAMTLRFAQGKLLPLYRLTAPSNYCP